MDHKEDVNTNEILRKGGFGEIEAQRLQQLRQEHDEQARQLAQASHRRLEFVRWLVSTGKLSDQIA